MTDTNWIPAIWDSATSGNRVRLIAGETVIVGTLVRVFASGDIGVRLDGLDYENVFGRNDLDLFVEAPAVPELPTEPGLYLSSSTDLDVTWVFELRKGHWWLLNTNSLFPIGDGHLERHAPFTRLESRADTAKAVLERIDAESIYSTGGRDSDHRIIYDDRLLAITAEFGVSS